MQQGFQGTAGAEGPLNTFPSEKFGLDSLKLLTFPACAPFNWAYQSNTVRRKLVYNCLTLIHVSPN